MGRYLVISLGSFCSLLVSPFLAIIFTDSLFALFPCF
jgi:hypothetical protein